MPHKATPGAASTRCEALDETKEATALHHSADATQALSGWAAELLVQIATAPDRRVASSLLALSRDAVDALPEPRRELLLERLQDAIRELPLFRA